MDKYRAVTLLQTRLLNHPLRVLLQAGAPVPGYALLETVGRRSGQPRTTPVGDGRVRRTDTFWLVAEHGRRAGYVRNVEADPRVRVRVGGRWRTGTAQVLEDDDPVARQRTMPRLNALAVRAMGTDLLSIRIDLDPL